MKFEVHYELLTHDGDGPVRERKTFEVTDITGAQKAGEDIARNRAKEIRRAGGVAEVRSIQVKRCYKPNKS